MTTLHDRPNTALLIVDVQNAVVARAFERDRIVGNIGRLVDRARQRGAAVIWIRHADEHLEHGSQDWQIVPELSPVGAEPVVEKHYQDAFEETVLESLLAERGVGHVLVTGAQTDACIRSTIHGAFVRGYDATLVSDGHTTEDLRRWGAPAPEQVIAHTNLYWSGQRAPGRRAATVGTEDVTF